MISLPSHRLLAVSPPEAFWPKTLSLLSGLLLVGCSTGGADVADLVRDREMAGAVVDLVGPMVDATMGQRADAGMDAGLGHLKCLPATIPGSGDPIDTYTFVGSTWPVAYPGMTQSLTVQIAAKGLRRCWTEETCYVTQLAILTYGSWEVVKDGKVSGSIMPGLASVSREAGTAFSVVAQGYDEFNNPSLIYHFGVDFSLDPRPTQLQGNIWQSGARQNADLRLDIADGLCFPN